MFKILCSRFGFQGFKKFTNAVQNIHNKRNHFHFDVLTQNFSLKFNCTINSNQGAKISWIELKDLIQDHFTEKSFQSFESQLCQIFEVEELDVDKFDLLKNQYKFLFDAIENLDLIEFLKTMVDFKSIKQETLTISLMKMILLNLHLKELENFDLLENESERIFFFMTILIFKKGVSINPKLIEYCEKQTNKFLKKAIKEKNLEKEALIKHFFLLYCENRSLVSLETTRLMDEYFVTQIKYNEFFSKNDVYLLEIVRKIEQNPTFIDLNNPHLLQHETPFQIVTNQENAILTQGDNILLVESPTDIIFAIQTIAVGKLTGENELKSLNTLSNCLKILKTSNYKTRPIIINIIKTLERTLETSVKNQSILIDICFQIVGESRGSLAFLREFLKKSLKIIYDTLYSMPLNVQQCLQIYSIFRHTQTIDKKLLAKLEEKILPKINSLEVNSFLNFFFFYASIPSAFRDFEVPKMT